MPSLYSNWSNDGFQVEVERVRNDSAAKKKVFEITNAKDTMPYPCLAK